MFQLEGSRRKRTASRSKSQESTRDHPTFYEITTKWPEWAQITPYRINLHRIANAAHITAYIRRHYGSRNRIICQDCMRETFQGQGQVKRLTSCSTTTNLCTIVPLDYHTVSCTNTHMHTHIPARPPTKCLPARLYTFRSLSFPLKSPHPWRHNYRTPHMIDLHGSA